MIINDDKILKKFPILESKRVLQHYKFSRPYSNSGFEERYAKNILFLDFMSFSSENIRKIF